MLIRNIRTDLGLVNGAMGTVASVDFTPTGKAISINVRFDDPLIGRTFQNTISHDPIQISVMSHTFIHSGRSVVRKNFPWSPCWACTIHKVQGLSLDKAVVDIGSLNFELGMCYVALSRVRTLNGLALSAFNPSLVRPFDNVLEEYARLRELLNKNNTTK